MTDRYDDDQRARDGERPVLWRHLWAMGFKIGDRTWEDNNLEITGDLHRDFDRGKQGLAARWAPVASIGAGVAAVAVAFGPAIVRLLVGK